MLSGQLGWQNSSTLCILKVYTISGGVMHYHSRIFKSGNSLAIRIPKRFHFSDQQEVEMFMRNGDLVIRVAAKNLAEAFLQVKPFPDDVLDNVIEDLPPQERDF